MCQPIHKNGIAKGFSQAAASYDHWAGPQRRIALKLAELLPENPAYLNIADLGCGTGFLTELLLKRYPTSKILAVDLAEGMIEFCTNKWPNHPNLRFLVADLETCTFETNLDMITSSCAFQWLTDSTATLARLADALVPGGVMAASFLVDGTLQELVQSSDKALDVPMAGLTYKTSEFYCQLLKSAGMNITICHHETVTAKYKTGLEALQSFKGIGATFQHHGDYTPLTSAELRRLVRTYEQQHQQESGMYPLTYQAACIIAQKPE